MSETRTDPVSGVDVDVMPGDVVRTLFDRNEQVLAALRLELDEAERETDAAESRVRSHPALGLLAPDEVEVLVPAAREAAGGLPLAALPPRTTVVRRPRATPSAADGGPEARGDGGAGTADDTRTRAARLVTSHWVWKAGVAVTVVALLLLKFG